MYLVTEKKRDKYSTTMVFYYFDVNFPCENNIKQVLIQKGAH